MFDLAIQNARICDGAGSPSYIGSLGVKEGRIASIGTEKGLSASQTIDADGLVLAPGFVDPHTHYDAQVAWDPLLTCSPWHGVTTVVIGNCGVGVAPVKAEAHDSLLYDLVNVEDIPYEVMKEGINWQWESYGDYLDCIDGLGLGINIAGLVALTPLRTFIMGIEAAERHATAKEIGEMIRLFRQAMEGGAFGFSTSNVSRHLGHEGRPLACRNASKEELSAMCRVLKDMGLGTIQIALNSAGRRLISDKDLQLLELLTSESGRKLTWLALFARSGEPDFHQQTIDKMGSLLDRAIPQVTPRPLIIKDDLTKPFLFSLYPSFKSALNRPVKEQMELYRRAEFREGFLKDMGGHVMHKLWRRVRVLESSNPRLQSYPGRNIFEIAEKEAKRPIDVYLDMALLDGLQTKFQTEAFNYDQQGVKRLVTEDRFMIGLSDGGAHVTMLCDAGYATALLEIWVRKRKALTLESAVNKLTKVPADLYGIPDRGVLVEGKVADLVLFDPDTVASKPPEFVDDFPLGSRRLVAKAEGIIATFVAGRQVYENGNHTGIFPGRVLRSYE